MNIIDLENPLNTEKYIAPKVENLHPFYITEYGKTFPDTPCYQLRMDSPVGCVQYVISGSGIIICNDKMYAVKEGDTFLLPQGSNQIYYSNPDNQFSRIWLNFKGELAQAFLHLYQIENVIVFPQLNTYELLTQIQATCRACKDPLLYQNESSRLFLALVQFLAQQKPQNEEVTSPVESIRLFIDCHITENLKISDIAEHFSFSQEHVIRTFKKSYGITPHQYILQSKIRLSMIMLKVGTYSIEEISEKLNFSDPRHFSSQFQKYVGYRPSQYRRPFPAE